jgi:hypothetical protein
VRSDRRGKCAAKALVAAKIKALARGGKRAVKWRHSPGDSVHATTKSTARSERHLPLEFQPVRCGNESLWGQCAL